MNNKPKMLPGQEPYTEEELRRLYSLVNNAAAEDPGEQAEAEGEVYLILRDKNNG